MIQILIISVFIEKSFYLLRRQSFSFQIVSEYSDFMSWGLAFDLTPCFVLERGFVHSDCPGGKVFAPFESFPWGDGFG